MRLHRLVIGLVCWLVLLVPQLARPDDEIAIIVGHNAPHIDMNRINLVDIFLRRIRIDEHKAEIVPLNLDPSDPARDLFSEIVLRQHTEALQRYWTEQYFHGLMPPHTVSSQEAMIRFVSITPNSVGYVLACKVDDRVHVVAMLPVPVSLHAVYSNLCAMGGK